MPVAGNRHAGRILLINQPALPMAFRLDTGRLRRFIQTAFPGEKSFHVV
jgi:hypothetical protein